MKYTKLGAMLLAAGVISIAACSTTPNSNLAERWSALRVEQPKLQPRDAAQKLNVSEAELVATNVGKGVTRLRDGGPAYKAVYDRLHELGQIKAITRNDTAVLERVGTVTQAKLNADGRVIPGTGFAGGPIDLRFGADQWRSAFAVVQPGREGKTSRSLQFFDVHGNAVNKVYLDNEAGVAAFDKLVADFKAPEQLAYLSVDKAPTKVVKKPNGEVDVKELRDTWNELSDVHEFPRLLKDLGITREQALDLIGKDAAYRISAQSVLTLLDSAAKQGQPIMVFVSNPGMTQIFSGKITKVKATEEWYNVLDPDFNLHLRQAGIDHGWVVKRPAKDGVITSVEFYDAKGEQVVNFFSRRDRNKEETTAWRNIVASLAKAS
ncbi:MULTISPECIES: ChuX/HutX family heme-like substrate-binding protein [unclassified Herbaspirillum]|uniref:hemin-degrading factor n=1 Tax=unclassified Herbaspirillum TaxID=2624150 RepID=UPI000E2EDDA3|nr:MULTISPECIES: ChuX/HutX family heme-like substrate-binding protein [unclassified Herbaspirillum]RFB67561.1 hemin-degrading factor [Herbaspirillum sp. 3R-3a1]TFI05171.1 hemin-degrading factor [Herbaspirillum sp. 3R11]TFI12499.1 hemin-degrading factor [Herbaspirillum sp. 3R-11]TFI19689.1 hemin-degrading factor [Herbaspirillum sp. 3C11]